MSVIIDFSQIQSGHILSENKVCGIYEVDAEKIITKKSCYLYLRTLDILFENALEWGEAYHQPDRSKFLFYLLAKSSALNIGFKNIDGINRILAFSPIELREFFEHAKKQTKAGTEGVFNELIDLINESIEKGYLIIIRLD